MLAAIGVVEAAAPVIGPYVRRNSAWLGLASPAWRALNSAIRRSFDADDSVLGRNRRRTLGRSMAQIMGDVLGRGVTGNVFRAINSEAGEFVAVKQLQLRAVPAETVRRLQNARCAAECRRLTRSRACAGWQVKSLQDEIERLKKLAHPNIVQFVDVITTPLYMHLVMECPSLPEAPRHCASARPAHRAIHPAARRWPLADG